jgi:hypothetical protein
MGKKPVGERGKGLALTIPAVASRKGHKPRYCGARTHQGGHPCKLTAGWGTTHPGYGTCRFHLGASTTHVLAAQKEASLEVMSRFGAPRQIQPQEAMFELLARSAGHVDELGRQIETLPPEQVTGALRLYAIERDHMLKVGRAIYESGLADDTRRHMDALGALLVGVIQSIVVDLGHDPKDPEVLAVIQRNLQTWPEGSA